MSVLLEPFSYNYMLTAIIVSSLVGAVCAFLSAYVMLKGWSLIGDALSHAVVPGVAGAYMLSIPFSLGAFFTGGLASLSILFLSYKTRLKDDVIIGIIFVAFLSFGLFMISISPVPINIENIISGNILAINSSDVYQLYIISLVSLLILFVKRRDFMMVFFDEIHARTMGISVMWVKVVFFCILSASCVAAIHTVGALLIISLVITPGATAYLLTDRFEKLIVLSLFIGVFTSAFGVYASYFLNTVPGAVVVCLQFICFLCAFLFAPQNGFVFRTSNMSQSE